MGKALSYAIREKIVERREKGDSFSEIAQSYNCSESGAKKIWYAYKKEGKSSLYTKYDNCGGHSIYNEEIRQKTNTIRDNQQGAYYVRSKLVQKDFDHPIPSARTLNRWWVKAGTNRKRGRPSSDEKKNGLQKLITLGK